MLPCGGWSARRLGTPPPFTATLSLLLAYRMRISSSLTDFKSGTCERLSNVFLCQFRTGDTTTHTHTFHRHVTLLLSLLLLQLHHSLNLLSYRLHPPDLLLPLLLPLISSASRKRTLSFNPPATSTYRTTTTKVLLHPLLSHQ